MVRLDTCAPDYYSKAYVMAIAVFDQVRASGSAVLFDEGFYPASASRYTQHYRDPIKGNRRMSTDWQAVNGLVSSIGYKGRQQPNRQ
jgi:hypothetical protein